MRTLRERAVELARAGVTSLQEVNRVTLVERAGAAED
jgi:type II secretory ATPase GspE/PulE/Tfp pilus assembly ATPase PilB-like protein